MFIRINSTDHTDVIINTDKVSCVQETKAGCCIFFSGEHYIESTAQFEEIAKVLGLMRCAK